MNSWYEPTTKQFSVDFILYKRSSQHATSPASRQTNVKKLKISISNTKTNRQAKKGDIIMTN